METCPEQCSNYSVERQTLYLSTDLDDPYFPIKKTCELYKKIIYNIKIKIKNSRNDGHCHPKVQT